VPGTAGVDVDRSLRITVDVAVAGVTAGGAIQSGKTTELSTGAQGVRALKKADADVAVVCH